MKKSNPLCNDLRIQAMQSRGITAEGSFGSPLNLPLIEETGF